MTDPRHQYGGLRWIVLVRAAINTLPFSTSKTIRLIFNDLPAYKSKHVCPCFSIVHLFQTVFNGRRRPARQRWPKTHSHDFAVLCFENRFAQGNAMLYVAPVYCQNNCPCLTHKPLCRKSSSLRRVPQNNVFVSLRFWCYS